MPCCEEFPIAVRRRWRAAEELLELGIVAQVELPHRRNNAPAIGALDDEVHQRVEGADGAGGSCRVQRVNDEVARLGARPVIEDGDEFVLQAEFVAQGAKAGGIELVDSEQDHVRSPKACPLDEFVQGTGFSRPGIAEDQEVPVGGCRSRVLRRDALNGDVDRTDSDAGEVLKHVERYRTVCLESLDVFSVAALCLEVDGSLRKRML
jgi:hypothetical protein